MYKHIVLWKVKESANGMGKADLVEEVVERLMRLPKAIPQIVDYEVGANIGSYGASFFDVSLISCFENEESFKQYCQNELHNEVVAFIASIIDAEEIVDYYDA